MNKKKYLSEMTRDRANELRFRTWLCKMLENNNNDFSVVKEYVKHISLFMDIDVNIIIEIMREILDMRYEPTKDELIKINLLFGSTLQAIADRLNMNISTVKMHIYRNKYNIETIVLYPRLKKYQLEELRKFFKQYYKFYVPIDKVYAS